MVENKETIENVETTSEEMDAQAIVDSLFNNKKEEKEPEIKKVKRPENIFSRPIPVTQDETAKKQRLKITIIEGVLFGAFLTAITVIYSVSGLMAKMDSANGSLTPSLVFFGLEFVVFSVLMCIGDYFLTEKRVNDYNAAMTGISTEDIADEIAKALREQEEEGITPEDAAAQNKANGEEATFIEVKCVDGEDDLTNKKFEAYIKEEKFGELETVKGVITDANGMESVVLKVSKLIAGDSDFKNGVAMELINGAKASAAENSLAAVCIPEAAYGDLDLNTADKEKYNITFPEGLKVVESYPGALMGVSGELE